MTNPFHLLLPLPDPRGLSRCVAGRLRAYLHQRHRRHGLVGPLFQGRFQSPALDLEMYLLRWGRYLERNPLAAGRVPQPWLYRWSSCRT